MKRRLPNLITAMCAAGLLLLVGWRYQDLPLGDKVCFYDHRKGTLLDRLERVHVVPRSVDPSRINDPTNIIVMHHSCHKVWQHYGGNYHVYNPRMLEAIAAYTNWLPCVKGE